MFIDKYNVSEIEDVILDWRWRRVRHGPAVDGRDRVGGEHLDFQCRGLAGT